VALANGTIPNMVGGISQQKAVLRLPNQSDGEVNTFPAIVDGNKKRPPSEHVAFIPFTTGPSDFSHFIVRDINEQYVVNISGGAINVCGIDGSPRTVSLPNGAGYLTAPTGVIDSQCFEALTIADYTFIVNKSVKTLLAPVYAPVRPPEALITVLAGNYGKRYSITLNGIEVAAYSTPNGHDTTDAKYVDTAVIAQQLYIAMTGIGGGSMNRANEMNVTGSGLINAAGGWGVSLINNAIYIYALTGVDFTISIQDGYNGHAMKLVKGETQYFTDLGAYAPDGFVAKIIGDTNAAQADYYVRFSQPGGIGQGSWKECPQPGVVIGIDASTMPHTLIRNADGTFTFSEAAWAPRVSGDALSAPPPSFIGQTINAMTFYEDRLGFLCGQNSISSRSGDFFNFWRTSAVTLLDTDPIDVNASSGKVANLRASTIYQQQLILWSDFEQFSYGGNALLTPKTVHMQPVTPYPNIAYQVNPVETPRRILFCNTRDQYTSIHEWYTDIYYHIGQADEATAHVPTLIPAGAFKMTVSNIEDMAAILTTLKPSSIFLYKYFWSGQDKVQAAFTEWQLPGATVLNAQFINSVLYVILKRGTVTTLEKFRVNPVLRDNGGPTVLLDRRVTGLTGTYDALNDVTTYTLPFTHSDGTQVTAASAAGMEAPIASVSGATVVMRGNQTAIQWYFGEPYTMTYDFSPIFVRQPGADGKSAAVQEGRLQLLKLDISYTEALYFRVEVTPPGRPTRSYEFTDLFADDANPDLDSINQRDGIFTVPIKSQSDYVKIRIVNDSPFQAHFTRAEWKGNFVPKARK
jgi:hypothetical protein